MSDLSDQIGADIQVLLRDLGTVLTVRRVIEGAYNPLTGIMVAPVTSDIDVIGAFVPYRDKDIDGTRILQTDRRYYIEASADLPAPPTTGDKLVSSDTAGAGAFNIVSVKTYAINGEAVAYALQVRNA